MVNVQLESQILVELQQVHQQLRRRKKEVKTFSSKIHQANRQLERLTTFWAAFGISASFENLKLTTTAITEFRPVELIDVSDDDLEEVENNPIPFSSFDDDDDREF